MVYSVRSASELLGLKEDEIERHIRDGTLIAEWQNGQWEIPDWSLRVFLRTKEAIRKFDKKAIINADRDEYGLLTQILERLDGILETRELHFKWLEQLDTFRFRITELENRLLEKEGEVERLREALKFRVQEHENELKHIKEEHRLTLLVMDQEISALKQRIKELEEKSQYQKEHSFLTQASQGARKDGLWDRLVKMLTWD